MESKFKIKKTHAFNSSITHVRSSLDHSTMISKCTSCSSLSFCSSELFTLQIKEKIAKNVPKFIVQNERTSKYFCFTSLHPRLPAVLGYLFYWGVYCCFQTLGLLLCAAGKYWISIGRDDKLCAALYGPRLSANHVLYCLWVDPVSSLFEIMTNDYTLRAISLA